MKLQSYWWDLTPPRPPSGGSLPARAEVVVVGAGYTGLSAAIALARAGREVVVLDAEEPGFGCSTRNGGQAGPGIHRSYDELAGKFGPKPAFALKREGQEAYSYLTDFIERDGIDCAFERCGHFVGAHTPGHFQRLRQAVENQPRGLKQEAYVVPQAEQRNEVGSDAFYGGAVFPAAGALDPGRYHAGLLDRAEQAGARVFGKRPVLGIERDGSGFTLRLADGTVTARDVVLATNGYTGRATPWWQRRVIPIGSYIIATEPLDAALMQRLCPKRRMMQETRTVIYYYRPSPDQRRILFGGRVALRETDPKASAPRLQAAMVRVFPELANARLTHSWMGFIAYTFDALPHIGVQDGVHYAMGYCGSGISLSSYLGYRIAQRLLGSPEGRTAFDGPAFQTRPLYWGNPWFLAPSVLYYRLRDRFGR